MKRWFAIALLVGACTAEGPGAPGAGQVEPSSILKPAPDASVESGPGVITFGTAIDPDTLAIVKPYAKFKRTYPAIAWSAAFTRPIGLASINLVIVRLSRAGAEETMLSEAVPIADPEATILTNVIDLAALVDNDPGTYVMRYVRSVEVLAAGTFILVE
jgi:hypothetical protein